VTRKKAWEDFRLVSTYFLGYIRAENYKELIEDRSSYHKVGCNMSLKIHMLRFKLDFFPDNCGMVSDEHGEIFMRNLQQWRNDIREIVPLPRWLITVGRSSQMLLNSYTSDRQFWIFIVIFGLKAPKLTRNGYCNLRSIMSVKICCPL